MAEAEVQHVADAQGRLCPWCLNHLIDTEEGYLECPLCEWVQKDGGVAPLPSVEDQQATLEHDTAVKVARTQLVDYRAGHETPAQVTARVAVSDPEWLAEFEAQWTVDHPPPDPDPPARSGKRADADEEPGRAKPKDTDDAAEREAAARLRHEEEAARLGQKEAAARREHKADDEDEGRRGRR